MAHRESLTPRRLLQLFEEGPRHLSGPLLTKSPNEIFPTPTLLPGETLILQQDTVSCIGTLNNVANGVLHLTNYRIIFNGSSIQDISYDNPSGIDAEDLARQGYRYQRRRYQFPMHRVNPQLKKFQSYLETVKKSGRTIGNSFKRNKQRLLFRKYSLDEEDTEDAISPDTNCVMTDARPILERSASENPGRLIQDKICITIPNLSISNVQKFPKQYLEKERLKMLRDGIEIICTNLQTFRFGLGGSSTFDADELVERLIRHAIVKNLVNTFVVRYSGNLLIPPSCNILEDKTAPNFFKLDDECKRLGIFNGDEFHLKKQKTCDVYPQALFVPVASEGSLSLRKIAEYHNNGCFPAVVWRHRSGSMLLRSSSPLSQRGNADARCKEDEYFMEGICRTAVSANDIKLKIFTQRTKQDISSANSPSSGALSVEEGLRYYYPHCLQVNVDEMPDCQSVQESGVKLMTALNNKSDDGRYLSSLEESGWFLQVQKLIQTASSIAMTLEADKISALVAFSTGTDQTSQITSLAQLMVDPFYRTIDGFQILLQKEWISFKHNFIRRNLTSLSMAEDISPIFLQFLDCVWQLTQQFPTYFQFNDGFLECLAEHAYSGRFGTFFNKKISNSDHVVSFWTWINVVVMATDDFTNPIFDEDEGHRPIFPETGMEWLQIWTWHKRFQREENLVQAIEMKMMQTEKSQRDYKEVLEKYLNLMEQLTEKDETYPSSFHTRSAGELFDGSHPTFYTSDSDSSSVASRDRVDGNGIVKGFNAIFGKKSKSFNDLLSVRGTDEDYMQHGHSTFYDVNDTAKSGSMGRKSKISTLPSSLEISEKFTSLRDYLDTRGIKTQGVTDVQISAKKCSGYLIKQGKLHKNWKKRWFVLDLEKRCIAYFDHPMKEPKRVFSYLSVEDVRPHQDQHKNPNLFLLRTFDRTFYIQAPGHQAMDIWVACLSVSLTALLP